MSGLEIFAFMLVIFIGAIILTIPVPFAMMLSSVAVLLVDDALTPFLIIDRTFKAYNSFLLLAVPFFLLASNLMNGGGLTDRLMGLSRALVGHFTGGLAQVNIFASMLFAGVSGSSSADAAGIGQVMIPAMEKEGYDKPFSVAVTACSSVMGVILPPSIIMIIWGGTMNTSIAGMFLGGAIPGVLIGLFMMATTYVYAKKRKYPVTNSFELRRVFKQLQGASISLMMPVIVVGGIVFGLFTPTEAAIIAALYALCICSFLYRTLNFKQSCNIFYETAYFSGMMLFNIGTASAFSWVLSFYQVPQELVESIAKFEFSPLTIALLITLIFLVVGLFMDNIPAVIVLAPILKPLADSVGMHPVQFAIIGVIALAYGLVTPPYGICLLITTSIGQISVLKALKEIVIFLVPMLLILLLVILFPSLVLWLPQMVFPEFL